MIGRQLLAVSDPRLLKIVLKDGDIAGFAFVFPDVVKTLQATGGRLWPFGWLRLLVALRRTGRLLGNGVGLLPAYQGMGGNAMMYVELEKIIRSRGAGYMEFAQVMESNLKSLGDAKMLGVRWHKRYRVYRRAVRAL
jgi:GNAT superfamily N-acetyltransferase